MTRMKGKTVKRKATKTTKAVAKKPAKKGLRDRFGRLPHETDHEFR